MLLKYTSHPVNKNHMCYIFLDRRIFKIAAIHNLATGSTIKIGDYLIKQTYQGI